MAETYRYPKRHQGRFREGRRQILTYRGSVYGLIGKTDCLEIIDKV